MDNDTKMITLYEFLGTYKAENIFQGGRVYTEIVNAFDSGLGCILDFQYMEVVTEPFMKSAIGSLEGKYGLEFLDMNLFFMNLNKKTNDIIDKLNGR